MFSFTIVLSLAAAALAYPSGAPEGACQTLTPKHQVNPQASPSPYALHVSANSVRSGEAVTVTVHGGDFKGFLVVARDAATGQPVGGSWSALDNTAKALSCGLTQTSNNDKQQASGQWTAPAGFRGSQVVFQAAVVRDIDTFWNNLSSTAVSVQ